ncbi:MAG: signal peptidase I, partial [Cellulosilyticaceae bacterium]
NFLEFMKEPMLAVLAALLINQFLFMHTRVPTGSMEKTIMPKDHLVVNRVPTYYRDPMRGEIVVFEGDYEKLIKRVIGLPGDVIDLKDNVVYINGEALDEKAYINLDEVSDREVIYNVQFPYEVPEESYFLMGDNRGNSLDSRYFGPVSRDKILAIGAVKIWPLSQMGVLE